MFARPRGRAVMRQWVHGTVQHAVLSAAAAGTASVRRRCVTHVEAFCVVVGAAVDCCAAGEEEQPQKNRCGKEREEERRMYNNT